MNEDLLFYFGRMQALITEREGMIAENHIRMANGLALAYDMDSFAYIAKQLEELAKGVY